MLTSRKKNPPFLPHLAGGKGEGKAAVVAAFATKIMGASSAIGSAAPAPKSERRTRDKGGMALVVLKTFSRKISSE
jgi:hypothetical protein